MSGGRPGSALLVLPWRRAGVDQSAQGREAPGRHLRRLPPSKSPKRFVRPAVPRPAAEGHFGTGGQPRPRDKRGPRAAGFCPAPRPRPDLRRGAGGYGRVIVHGTWSSGEIRSPSVKSSGHTRRSASTLSPAPTAGLSRCVPDPVPDPVLKTTRPRSLKDLPPGSSQKKPATPTLGPERKPVGRGGPGGSGAVDTVRARVSGGIQKIAGGQRGLGRVTDPVAAHR